MGGKRAHRKVRSAIMSSLRWAVLLVAAGCGVSYPSDARWPDRPMPPYASSDRFAITVNLGDTLAFVSADPLAPSLFGAQPVGEVPVELEGPHHLAASPDGRFVYMNLSNYVPGTGSGPHGAHGTGTVPGSLVKLDARNAQRIAEVLVDRSPGEVILSPDGATAYVSHYDLLRLQAQLERGDPPEAGWSTVAIVDTENMRRIAMPPVCATAHGMALSSDGATLYVTCAQSDELVILDVRDRARPILVKRLFVGPLPGPLGQPAYSPYACAVSPKDGTVFISNNASGDVRVYDPARGAMDPARVHPLGGVAMFGAFSPDGGTFFVPSQGNDVVTRIDTTTGDRAPLALPRNQCLNAHALVPTPDGKSAVVVCEGDKVRVQGTVVSMSLEAFLVTGSVEVGLFPDGAAWLPAAR
jgi:DNA-binding beta-propeller fold protein YncE